MMELKVTSMENKLADLNNWEMWVGKVQNEEDGIRKREHYFINNNAKIGNLEQQWMKAEKQLWYLKHKRDGNKLC